MARHIAGAALVALTWLCVPHAGHGQEPEPTPIEDPPQRVRPPAAAAPAVPEALPAAPAAEPAAPEPAPPAPAAKPAAGGQVGLPRRAAPAPRVEVGIGASVHLDGYWISADESAAFGSPAAQGRDGLFLRRALLLLGGRVGDWRFRFEPDFATDAATGDAEVSFQELYAARRVGPGEIRIGQRRPFRGMEDLTASNDLLLMERPFAGASGLFAGGQRREFALGLFYQGQEDRLTYGLGAYSLRAVDTPGTEGFGASLRTAWTPWTGAGGIVHVGASASYEDPANDQSATPPTTATNIGTAVSYAGLRGPVAVLGMTSGAQPATTLGLELAATLGPVFAQAEVMSQTLEQRPDVREQTILAYYLQASVFVTGETKPYNAREAVFRSPSPAAAAGAWELTARYDEAGNRDATAIPGGCGGNALARDCEARALTLGTNYYFSAGVRLMVNYIMAEADRGRGGTDSPDAVAARFQLAF